MKDSGSPADMVGGSQRVARQKADFLTGTQVFEGGLGKLEAGLARNQWSKGTRKVRDGLVLVRGWEFNG